MIRSPKMTARTSMLRLEILGLLQLKKKHLVRVDVMWNRGVVGGRGCGSAVDSRNAVLFCRIAPNHKLKRNRATVKKSCLIAMS